MKSLFNHVFIMNSLFNLFIMVLYFIFIEDIFIRLCSQCQMSHPVNQMP